jgi:cell cycle sensor histidine kinase DivJ
MSHELKTPLNAIIGFADLLRTPGVTWTPLQVAEYASLIHAGGMNLLRLLTQILDLTRIAGGRYELRRQPLNACSALRDVRDSFGDRADAKALSLGEVEGDDEIAVDADESALRTMLGQLVDNAVNFCPPGAAVRLGLGRMGATVRFTVADNGPGVAPEDLARILEPFEQVGRGTADHKGGAGLGLTLTKALAELHGGSLTLSSTPGKGFTALLELPLARPQP